MDGQARAIRAGRRREDQARRVQSSVPFEGNWGFLFGGQAVRLPEGKFPSSPSPAGLASLVAVSFTGSRPHFLSTALWRPWGWGLVARSTGPGDARFFCGHGRLSDMKPCPAPIASINTEVAVRNMQTKRRGAPVCAPSGGTRGSPPTKISHRSLIGIKPDWPWPMEI
jgi:hypothetical protein